MKVCYRRRIGNIIFLPYYFYLKPFTLHDKVTKRKQITDYDVAISALFWGFITGLAIYMTTKDITNSFAFGFAVAFSFSFAGSGAVAVSLTFLITFLVSHTFGLSKEFSSAVAVAGAGAGAGAFVGAGAFAGAGSIFGPYLPPGAGAAALSLSLITGIVNIGIIFPQTPPTWAIILIAFFWGIIPLLTKIKHFNGNMIATLSMIWVSLSLLLFPYLAGGIIGDKSGGNTYSWIYVISNLIGFLGGGATGFVEMFRKNGSSIDIEPPRDNYFPIDIETFGRKRHFLWLWFGVAFVLFFGESFLISENGQNVRILSYAFLLIPIFFNNLPLYPFESLYMIFSYDLLKKRKQEQTLQHEIPWYGQDTPMTFNQMTIFPLPKLSDYLVELCATYDNIENGLENIDFVINRTFQYGRGHRAAELIIDNPETSHKYAHYLLVKDDEETLESLAIRSEVAWAYYLMANGEDVNMVWKKRRRMIRKKGNRLISLSDFLDSATERGRRDFSTETDFYRMSWIDKINAAVQIFNKCQTYTHHEEVRFIFVTMRQYLIYNSIEEFYRYYNLNMERTMNSFQNQKPVFQEIFPILLFFYQVQVDINSLLRENLKLTSKRDFLYQIRNRITKNWTFSYPIFSEIFQAINENWLKIIDQAISRIINVAHLTVIDYTPKTVTDIKLLTITVIIENSGEGIARNVHLEPISAEGDNFQVVDISRSEAFIESGDQKTMTVTIVPKHVGDISLHSYVVYDDNEKINRKVLMEKIIQFVGRKKWEKEISNPYIAGKPVSSDSLFVGRKDVIKFIKDKLRGDGQENVLILYGERRMGKTSALYRVMQEVFPDELCWIFIDIQGIANGKGATVDVLFYRFARKIRLSLKRQGKEKPHLPTKSNFSEDWRMTFEEYLTDVKVLINQPVIIILDEFDLLGKFESSYYEIMDYMRSLIQHSGIGFIIAGTYKLREQAQTYQSTFFNIGLFQKIGLLSRENSDRLVTYPVKKDVLYSENSLEEMWRVTAGHPYFIQKICREIVSRLNDYQRATVAYDDVKEIAEQIIKDDDEGILRYWYETASQGERAVIRTIYESIDETTGEYPNFEIVKSKNVLDLSDAKLRGVIEKLEKRDLIRIDKRKGTYRFRASLMQIWLKHHLPKMNGGGAIPIPSQLDAFRYTTVQNEL
ncbi:MAG: hypothetical protein B6244_12975 [Candidatus Cloacimonetes bacterium 4572_55]|nr:MAG: hypothetical protein B6244_12975 [Candidatus Cloacimonetes bacterium 4572_55]